MPIGYVYVPCEEWSQLKKDQRDKENVKSLLEAEFKDEECRVDAIRAILSDGGCENEDGPSDGEPGEDQQGEQSPEDGQ